MMTVLLYLIPYSFTVSQQRNELDNSLFSIQSIICQCEGSNKYFLTISYFLHLYFMELGHKHEFAFITYDDVNLFVSSSPGCTYTHVHTCACVCMHTHTVCHKSVQLVIFSSPEAQNSREIVQSGLMWRTSVCTHSSCSFLGETIKRGLKKECQREDSQHICLFFLTYIFLIYRCKSAKV